MDNEITPSIFEGTEQEKGGREWLAMKAVHHDKVPAFEAVSPRSTYEPRYVNIVHINRYRAA